MDCAFDTLSRTLCLTPVLNTFPRFTTKHLYGYKFLHFMIHLRLIFCIGMKFCQGSFFVYLFVCLWVVYLLQYDLLKGPLFSIKLPLYLYQKINQPCLSSSISGLSILFTDLCVYFCQHYTILITGSL